VAIMGDYLDAARQSIIIVLCVGQA